MALGWASVPLWPLARDARKSDVRKGSVVLHAGRSLVRTTTVALLGAVLLAGCASGKSRGTTGHRITTSDQRATLPTTPVCGNCTGNTPPPTALVKRLARPLHFPPAGPATCPRSPGRFFQTAVFGSMVVGKGPVRVGIDNAGSPRQGFHPAGYHGWLALKTHIVETPAYQGPFLVRTKRLDRPGVIRFGGTPAETAPLLILRGSIPSGAGGGWHDIPYFTFVRSPGCYGYQIDGLTFSITVVLRILTKYQP